MVTYSFLVAILLGGVVAITVSVVLLLVGGYGGYLRTVKAINALNDEVERVEEKITREVKTRAALSKKETIPDEFKELFNKQEPSLPFNRNVSRRR